MQIAGDYLQTKTNERKKFKNPFELNSNAARRFVTLSTQIVRPLLLFVFDRPISFGQGPFSASSKTRSTVFLATTSSKLFERFKRRNSSSADHSADARSRLNSFVKPTKSPDNMDLLGSILGQMEKPPVIKKSAEEQERLKSAVNFSFEMFVIARWCQSLARSLSKRFELIASSSSPPQSNKRI